MKKKFYSVVCVCVLIVILLLYCAFNENAVVINIGVKSYRMLISIICAAVMICILTLAVMLFLVVKEKKKTEAPQEDGMTEEDRGSLYSEIKTFGSDKWTNVDKLQVLYAQLNDMNEYQNNLKFLLTQTKYLKEQPVDIIQRVEDCMYVNVKKLLNYMRVLQRKDAAFMQQKIDECVDKNAGLLQKAKDFVIAVIDYVNKDMSPGEDVRAVDHVNSYMYIVLDAIEKDDIYLS